MAYPGLSRSFAWRQTASGPRLFAHSLTRMSTPTLFLFPTPLHVSSTTAAAALCSFSNDRNFFFHLFFFRFLSRHQISQMSRLNKRKSQKRRRTKRVRSVALLTDNILLGHRRVAPMLVREK